MKWFILLFALIFTWCAIDKIFEAYKLRKSLEDYYQPISQLATQEKLANAVAVDGILYMMISLLFWVIWLVLCSLN